MSHKIIFLSTQECGASLLDKFRTSQIMLEQIAGFIIAYKCHVRQITNFRT